MRFSEIILMGLAMSGATAASAQTGTSYQLMAKGRYAVVIDRLERQRAAKADTPEATLNLATAYARTGRLAEARVLYQQVLTEPAIDLDMLRGDATTSHQVARQGLATIAQSIAIR